MPTLAELIEPAPGRYAVQVETKDDWTPGGLYIPVETARSIHEQRPVRGTIVAIGEQDDDDLDSPPPRYKVGQVVVFGKYSGTEISYQPSGDRTKPKEKIIILSEKDILARIKQPTEAPNVQVKG